VRPTPSSVNRSGVVRSIRPPVGSLIGSPRTHW
jgi:hypothetical protein